MARKIKKYYPRIFQVTLWYNNIPCDTVNDRNTKNIVCIFFTSFLKIFVLNFVMFGRMGTSVRSLKYVHTNIYAHTLKLPSSDYWGICSSINFPNSLVQWSPLPLLSLPSWWFHRQLPLLHPHLSLELLVTRKYPEFTDSLNCVPAEFSFGSRSLLSHGEYQSIYQRKTKWMHEEWFLEHVML